MHTRQNKKEKRESLLNIINCELLTFKGWCHIPQAGKNVDSRMHKGPKVWEIRVSYAAGIICQNCPDWLLGWLMNIVAQDLTKWYEGQTVICLIMWPHATIRLTWDPRRWAHEDNSSTHKMLWGKQEIMSLLQVNFLQNQYLTVSHPFILSPTSLFNKLSHSWPFWHK